MTISLTAQSGLRACTAGLLVLLMTTGGQAAERHHDAHEHGVSEAKLAIDGNIVEIELESPGADIVGFEHPPKSASDKAAVAKAAGMLAKGGDIFAPAPAAQCNLIEADIDAPGMEKDHDGHDAKGHGKKAHGHEHEHEHKHGKKDQDHADHDKHTEDGHSEFKAHYRFRCRNTDKLTHIDVKLFQHFPGARELRVQAITPGGQVVRELKPGSARLTF